MTKSHITKRAIFYIDGFNLYHGCLANPERPTWSGYKWLDLEQFCDKYFSTCEVVEIRYFTALTAVDPTDPDRRTRQLTYWRALDTLPRVKRHEGSFSVWEKTRLLADPGKRPATPLIPHQKAQVIISEEKGSDVNLATYLLLDAFKDRFDRAVIVSNDSDLAEPIRLVKEEFSKEIAIINPRTRFARSLTDIADFERRVRIGHLKSSQLPDELTDTQGSIAKPKGW